MRQRRGFALIVALWVVTGGAALAFALSSVSRSAIGAARNRNDADIARWKAHGCMAVVRNSMYDALWPSSYTANSVAAAWAGLDQETVPLLASRSVCRVAMEPCGIRLDVNHAEPDELRRALAWLNHDPAPVDSLVDAVVDWRDVDDAPRDKGAERSWYTANHRAGPRNAPLEADEEILRIRGMDTISAASLGVRAERIYWKRAPAAVLAGLPGMTAEAISVLETHGRDAVTSLPDLASFPELSAEARTELATQDRKSVV